MTQGFSAVFTSYSAMHYFHGSNTWVSENSDDLQTCQGKTASDSLPTGEITPPLVLGPKNKFPFGKDGKFCYIRKMGLDPTSEILDHFSKFPTV